MTVSRQRDSVALLDHSIQFPKFPLFFFFPPGSIRLFLSSGCFGFISSFYLVFATKPPAHSSVSSFSPQKKSITTMKNPPLGRLLSCLLRSSVPGIYSCTCPDISDSLTVNGCDSVFCRGFGRKRNKHTHARAHTFRRCCTFVPVTTTRTRA